MTDDEIKDEETPLDRAVREAVAAAPPLTQEQKDKIAYLLRPYAS